MKNTSFSRGYVPPETATWPEHWNRPSGADRRRMQASWQRGFVPPHLPLLGETAEQVDSSEYAAVAERLYAAARREVEAGARHIVGLAAPQIGIHKQAFLFDPREAAEPGQPAVEQMRCILNPDVSVQDTERVMKLEGCLSLGPIKGWVSRPVRLTLTGVTPHGEPVEQEITGRAARAVHHEFDHTQGLLLPHRITQPRDLLWVSADAEDQFKTYIEAVKQGDRPPWPTLTPADQWHALRQGVAMFGELIPEGAYPC